MKERPILFSGSMVRAILAGTKTQTRRVAKGVVAVHSLTGEALADIDSAGPRVACPYGQPGDRLWVRETHAIVPRTAYRCSEGVQQVLRPDDDHDAAIYREGWTRSRSGFRWRPSIHMPRWASRITLEITEVRVERLQDISEDDLAAEGIQELIDAGVDHDGTPRDTYRALWESINGPGSWEANPWVWAVSFKRVETSSLVRPHVFHDLTCNSLGLSLGEASQRDQADGTAVAVTHNKAGQELAVEAAGGGHELHLSGPFGSTWETQCKAHPRGHGHDRQGGKA